MTSSVIPTETTSDTARPEPERRRKRITVALGGVLGVALLAGGAFGIARVNGSSDSSVEPISRRIGDAPTAGLTGRIGGGSLEETIRELELRTESVPDDYVSWATLGIAYVQQAHAVGDPSLYSSAERVLRTSIGLNDGDNFVAYAGFAALAAGRHDFRTAEQFAIDGLAINPSSAMLYGVLSDAQIQLGEYDAGFNSAQRMVDLSPDTASLARVSYTHELTGDVEEARALMQRALDVAANPGDQSFALFQLGELSLGEGDPTTALDLNNRALALAPDNVSAMSGKAHALGVSGQVLTAIDAYQELVEMAPLPDYLIEFGDFLTAHGRTGQAEALYQQARAQLELDSQNGVRADAGIIFFEADHGDPAKALADAESGIEERPFFEMYEAYAWALYVNQRFDEAAAAIDQAKQIGIRDAEMYVRAGLIDHARGDAEEAIREMRHALEIDPHVDQRANQMLELLGV
jgi:tetratricopeptide (TPR) repeat protein